MDVRREEPAGHAGLLLIRSQVDFLRFAQQRIRLRTAAVDVQLFHVAKRHELGNHVLPGQATSQKRADERAGRLVDLGELPCEVLRHLASGDLVEKDRVLKPLLVFVRRIIGFLKTRLHEGIECDELLIGSQARDR